MKFKSRLVKPLWDYTDAVHPREVVTYGVGTSLTTAQSHVLGDTLDNLSVGSFTCDVGDVVLVVYGAIPATSQWGLYSAENPQLRMSAHVIQLGDATNRLWDNNTAAAGFENRGVFAFFNRASQTGKYVTSDNDISSPYGPPTMHAAVSMVAAGTDAALGSIPLTLTMQIFSEIGAVRIVRWPSGVTAPSDTVLTTALEWMGTVWSIKNKLILYPPLFNYP